MNGHTDAPDDVARDGAAYQGEQREPKRFVRHVLLGVGITAATVILLLLLWYAADVLLVIFAGILLAVLLRGLADAVSQYTSLGSGWSLAVVLFALALFFGLGGWFLASELAGQVDQLTERLTASIKQLQQYLQRYAWGREILSQARAPAEMLSGRMGLLSQVTGFFSTALGVVANAVVVLFVGLYLAADPELYRRGLLRLLPLATRDRAREVLDTLGAMLRRWLVGRFVGMIAVGVTTGAGLWLLDIPLVMPLAMLAFALGFIPYLGPILSAVPAILVALTVGPIEAVYVGALYAGVQAAEGYLLTPLIQQRSVHLPPVLTISAQVMLGVLFGVIGIMLAEPLTVVAMVIAKMLYVEDTLGDSMERPA